jgi:nitroreductase/NAD-dependent dihydropyrimidine dehydrogenase PreA subunit
MSILPIIDSEGCTGCGMCVLDCPRRILALEDGRAKLVAENCMLCAHCYCVCPEDCITFTPGTLSETVLKTIDCDAHGPSSQVMDPAAFVKFARSRRSVRRFKDTPVPREVISDLIEFAATAPSGTNCKDWEFSVVEGRERVSVLAGMMCAFFARLNRMAASPLIRAMSMPFAGGKLYRYRRERAPRVAQILSQAREGNDLFLWNAPAVVAIHSGPSGSTPVEDAQLAAYNIALLAHALGIGTCFIGYAREAINRDRKIRRHLGIPESNRAHAVIALGYRDVEYLRLPLNKPHKAVWA